MVMGLAGKDSGPDGLKHYMAEVMVMGLAGDDSGPNGLKHYMAEVIRKVDVPGKDYYLVCDEEINYRGWGSSFPLPKRSL